MSNDNRTDRELWQRYQRAQRALPANDLGSLRADEVAGYAEDPLRMSAAERAALERQLLTDDDALEAVEQVRRTARTPPAVLGPDVIARAQSRLERERGAASFLSRVSLFAQAPVARRLAAAAVLVAAWAAGFASGRAGAPTATSVPVAAIPVAGQDPAPPAHMDEEWVLLDPEILRELDLDAAQRAALVSLDAEAREHERELYGSIRAAQLAVACAAKDPATSHQQLRDLSLALADLQRDSEVVRHELLERFAPSLGEAQRTRLTEMLASRSHVVARFDADGDGQLDRSERERLLAEMQRRMEQRQRGPHHSRPTGSGSERPVPPWRKR